MNLMIQLEERMLNVLHCWAPKSSVDQKKNALAASVKLDAFEVYY